MNAESNVNNGLTAEEAALIEAYRAKDFNRAVKVLGTKINEVEAEREAEKAAQALPILACQLVSVLDSAIDDLSYKLSAARGQKGRFAEEEAANDLLHALSEFLIQADIGHGYERETMAHRHHLADRQFSVDFFGASVRADGTLTPV